ncbi:MAG: hypothetical protein ACM3RP_03105 [Chitinophagales bacterium]
MTIRDAHELRQVIDQVALETPLTDVHTHLYPPSFGKILLWGIDELITYHYLVAETFRWANLPYGDFWKLDKRAQADLIWKTLFLEHSPVSEACRGVLTTLKALGLNPATRDLASYRRHFERMTVDQYVDRVFAQAKVEQVIMTNDPFDPDEAQHWHRGARVDPRFRGALRLDVLLNTWPQACETLRQWGYDVEPKLGGVTLAEVRRFLVDWIERIGAVYMAVSLPPTLAFPEESARGRLIAECVLPVSRERNVPFALMIGVKKLINPELRLAGDGEGKADIRAVEHLCAAYPRNKFLVTMLARENQHELAVAARKFRNLMPFGCWWFLNNPSLVDEITRMRLELLGLSMIPQHSDARVLDQLIYKWAHSRRTIADALFDKYRDLMETGWTVERAEIERDVAGLLGGNLWSFLKLQL